MWRHFGSAGWFCVQWRNELTKCRVRNGATFLGKPSRPQASLNMGECLRPQASFKMGKLPRPLASLLRPQASLKMGSPPRPQARLKIEPRPKCAACLDSRRLTQRRARRWTTCAAV